MSGCSCVSPSAQNSVAPPVCAHTRMTRLKRLPSPRERWPSDECVISEKLEGDRNVSRVPRAAYSAGTLGAAGEACRNSTSGIRAVMINPNRTSPIPTWKSFITVSVNET